MATQDQEIPETTGGLASDVIGLPSFLIDPESAAKRVRSKWFWIVPLIVTSVIGIAVGAFMAPMIVHVAEVAPMPDGVTDQQRQQSIAITKTITNVAFYLTPIFAAVTWAIIAGIMLGLASVLGVKARFLELFNLTGGCWLIQSLSGIATAVILHYKGEISTTAELKPPLGPDIFLAEGTNKFVMAAAASFSIFTIWWVVMMALVIAAAFRVSKAKGFGMVIPLWLLGMVGSLIGAIFQR